ncbi:carbon storage regulator CsrA [Cellulomonas fimi]|uniref:Translational regulator CsrA n=1 Tax=Cellulomonas fimi (strain ATCC 484 / DSM 20113 / JCM 1341 / CCUG 24087 / LMG 16345 / NBRC 15513 / NCIMB 8980 / NCTC 7547 / NRS-133) TaxID=590998 RepID=F4GZC2_CELFA|nr:carbon storage regulator CsrA [Cellulomonas fimi]AEE44843.1 carbon storage regulator, CsrA [Cellulomonas fimi ATCC 484]NNH09106.1 carbon storage regulator CsrA [Cellulomonas fimi]VEH27455.1 Carbon storage regulator [Cellulomonas fimi]
MLVLSRRVGERLVIGDDIVVTVIEVRSDGVRLGIDAPRDVRVHRAEVLDALTAANADAASADDSTAAALRRLVPPGTPSATPPAAPAPGAAGAPDSSAEAPSGR